MRQSKIKVIVIRVGEVPKVEEISNTLDAQQSLVGGYIEVIRINSDRLRIILNEEGRIYRLPINTIASKISMMTIVGNAFLTRYDSEGDNIDVTQKDIDEYLK